MNSRNYFSSVLVAVGLGIVFTAQSQTNLAVGLAADSEEAMRQKVLEENNQTRQDRYGKVIDQDGHPVAGVEVTGTIEFIQADKPDLHYKTQTDTNGLFQFTGLHGAGLAVKVAKAGYEMDNQSGGAVFDPSGQSSPTNRVIFMMWKLRGPEPMKHVQIQSPVLNGNEGKQFDLLESKMETLWNADEIRAALKYATGDLTVTVNCDPLATNRNQPFSWSCSLAITNGGLCETTEIYPYQAPADGYKPVVKMDFPTNMVDWKSDCRRTYYFTSNHGRVYGRMAFHLSAGSKFALFQADIYANPAGSRNLEFDPSKQIQ